MLLRHYLAADHVKRRRKSPYAMLLGFVPIVVFTMLTNLSQDLALWASFAAAFAVGSCIAVTVTACTAAAYFLLSASRSR